MDSIDIYQIHFPSAPQHKNCLQCNLMFSLTPLNKCFLLKREWFRTHQVLLGMEDTLSFATTDGFCKGQVQLFISRSCHWSWIARFVPCFGSGFLYVFCGKHGSKLRFGRMRCAGECCLPLLQTLVGFLQHADFEPSVWSRT